MTPTAKFVNHLTTAHGPEQGQLVESYRARIPGWSHAGHVFFFRTLLAIFPDIRRMAVCGVYHGLDLALISHLLWNEHRGREMELFGVDLFSDKPCADWPSQAAGKTWEEAGMGPPPSMEAAARNAPLAKLRQSDSVTWLKSEEAKGLEFVYLDTAHDYETLKAEILAARAQNPDVILGGDDYSGPGEWGVDRACDEILMDHVVFFGRIWLHIPSSIQFKGVLFTPSSIVP